MKITWTKITIATPIMLALVAGCGGGAPNASFAPNGALGQMRSTASQFTLPRASDIALTTSEQVVPDVHLNPQASWMDPDAKHTQYLLYVSDEAQGTVNIYAYRVKAGKMLGQLTGFQFPYGECVDNSANVYITDFAAAEIVEYPHGSVTPIRKLKDHYGAPIGCSINPKTGDLAVGDFEGLHGTCMGGVVIYAKGKHSETLYQDKDFDFYWPPGYDDKGNLFIQGRKKATRGRTGVAELAAGSSKLTTVSLSGGRVRFPGGMQWDGHYITATDQRFKGTRDSGIYQLTVSTARGHFVGSTRLTDTECAKTKTSVNDVVQPFISGPYRPYHRVVGGNLGCTYRYNFWSYIKGGDPKRSLPYNLAPELASGQTVSAMKR